MNVETMSDEVGWTDDTLTVDTWQAHTVYSANNITRLQHLRTWSFAVDVQSHLLESGWPQFWETKIQQFINNFQVLHPDPFLRYFTMSRWMFWMFPTSYEINFHITVTIILDNWNLRTFKPSNIKFQNFQAPIKSFKNFHKFGKIEFFSKNFQETANILQNTVECVSNSEMCSGLAGDEVLQMSTNDNHNVTETSNLYYLSRCWWLVRKCRKSAAAMQMLTLLGWGLTWSNSGKVDHSYNIILQNGPKY